MADQQPQLTAGRRGKNKGPTVVPHMHDLPLPLLLDHMGAEDGPSCNEEEMGAKRLRSASTTPRSTMGTHPNDSDRVMGVTSVGFQESVRFGEENDPEAQDVLDGVAHNSVDLDKTHDDDDLYHDANPGVGEIQGGYGSASVTECLGRLGIQTGITTSATCHSGEGSRDTNPRFTNSSHIHRKKRLPARLCHSCGNRNTPNKNCRP